MKKIIVGVLAGLVVAGGGTAVARTLITGHDVKNESLTGHDIKNGSVAYRDLSRGTQRLIRHGGQNGQDGQQGAQGPQGVRGPAGPQGSSGVANLEADGPYPGATHLRDGDNSDSAWASDGSLQTSWVECAPGKTALGGGFGQYDAPSADLNIVTSSPVQIKDGKTYLNDPSVYQPITGDPDGSFRPNGWLVQGYNASGHDVIVRPWVVCATVNP